MAVVSPDIAAGAFSNVWNIATVAGGENPIYIGRFTPSEAGKNHGADVTEIWTVGSDGNLKDKIYFPTSGNVLQVEDVRSITAPTGEIVLCVTTVYYPKHENGLVTWGPGIAIASSTSEGKIEVNKFFALENLGGKNITPVRVGKALDGSMVVDFDLRHDGEEDSHTLSRYRAVLQEDGEYDLFFLDDNIVPMRVWNEVMAGTGGGFIQVGNKGLEVGMVHGQKEVEERIINGQSEHIERKRKYFLGLAIRDESGKFIYLSEEPVFLPEDFPGDDLRSDVIALYTTDKGEIIKDEDGYKLRILISRGDSKTYWRDVLLSQEECQILGLEQAEEVAA